MKQGQGEGGGGGDGQREGSGGELQQIKADIGWEMGGLELFGVIVGFDWD